MASRVDPETSRYLARVRALPTLQREEELSLARAYLGGDEAAGQRILNANLHHVAALALRYRSLGVGIDELIAQGNLGLVAALRRFDPSRGVRFATYACHWVRAEMLTLALGQRSMVGAGRGPLAARYVFRMRRMHGHLSAAHGESAEVLGILAGRFGKTLEQLAEILQRIDRRDASFEQDGAREGSQSPAEVLHDDETPAADEVAARHAAQGLLGAAVARATSDLNERERFILEHRLLADAEQRMPLSAVGKSFGVTRERARQLEGAVRAKLRARLASTASHLDVDSAA